MTVPSDGSSPKGRAALARNVRLLCLFNFCTDFRPLAPVAILYYADVAGSFALGASVFSIVMVVAALLDVPTGIYSDRLGRTRCLTIGAGLAVAYAVCYATGGSYWVLALGAVCEGGSRAFYSGNNSALLYELLAREGRERQYHSYSGRLGAMFQLALGLSALLGGLLAVWSFAVVAWVSVLPQIGCLLVAARLDDPPRQGGPQVSAILHLRAAIGELAGNARLRLLAAAGVLGYAIGETTYQFQAAFYATLWPVWAIGAAKTLSGGLAAASFHFSGPLIDRFGHVTALLVHDVYNKVVGLAAVLFPSVASPLLMTSGSATFGVGSTAQGALMQSYFTADQRATLSSLSSFAASLLFAVVAYAAGLAADALGPTSTLLALQIAGLSVLGLRVLFVLSLRSGCGGGKVGVNGAAAPVRSCQGMEG